MGPSHLGHAFRITRPSRRLRAVLEALCRAAVLKALPTREEIDAAGCADAATFLEELRARSESDYTKFITERAVAWGTMPTQPEADSIDGLLAIIVRKVHKETNGKPTDPYAVAKWLVQCGVMKR